MERKYDANEFFGLNYLMGGVESPDSPEKLQLPKGDKTSKNIGSHAANAQRNNATNRGRKGVASGKR